jgi:hypothetical protein
MRRVFNAVVGVAVLAGFVVGQQPLPPLPTQPVVPAASVTPVAKPAAPIDRFLGDVRSLPETTTQAVYSVRAGGDWLARMNQPDGRFRAGFNPTLAQWLDDTSDTRQATAAVALSRTAAFTGDAKLTAAASQAALALFTMTKVDPADATVRLPALAADRGNPVAFAALTVLAVCELPAPDAKLLAKADELCAFLRKHLKPDGSVVVGDGQPGAAVPGLVCQALMTSDRWTAAQWKRDAVANAVAYYRPAFKQSPSAEFAGAMLPAVVDFCLRAKSDGGCGFAFEMADRLCDAQYTAADARNRGWIGGFKLAAGEPTAASLPCAHGVAAALHLAAQVPDATRFAKYRTATLEALKFGRALQLTAEGTRQFDKGYATQVLVGGAVGGPSDGCPRLDPTADLIAAQLRFLASGAEKGQ